MGNTGGSTLCSVLVIGLVAWGVGAGLIRVGPANDEPARPPRADWPRALPASLSPAVGRDTEGELPVASRPANDNVVFVQDAAPAASPQTPSPALPASEPSRILGVASASTPIRPVAPTPAPVAPTPVPVATRAEVAGAVPATIQPVEHVAMSIDPDPQLRPDDRIETRVVWLYFFRDATKVAQIINHNIETYRRLSVDGSNLALDLAQREADARTTERKLLADQFATADAAWRAVQPASANAVQPAAATTATLTAEQTKLRERRDVFAAKLQAAAQAEQASLQRVQDLSSVVADPELGVHIPADEQATDPLRRVSINVVGEGILQLRGPVRGINIIRTLISQIDTPTGQVRVALHALQVNGSSPQRIDPVAAEIQSVVDHARFMMIQSTQLLRQSIVKVAAQRAEQAPPTPERYLTTFFSTPLLDELRQFDSSLLRTDNHLLGMHSMDSTNLPAALLLLLLAREDVRQDILVTYRTALDSELPAREQAFIQAGAAAHGSKHSHHDEIMLLAQNAVFQSFFSIAGSNACMPDTLTPLQREVVRLAQVVKSLQFVEGELRMRMHQRLMWEEMRQHHQNQQRMLVPMSFPAGTSKADYTRQLDLVIHDLEEKYIDLLEGTRSHTATVDGFLQQVIRALEDDLAVQFLQPSFQRIRALGRHRGVSVGSIETTTVLANNRGIARVYPQAVATMNLPQREVVVVEGLQAAEALAAEAVATASNETFRSLVLLASGQPAPMALAGTAPVDGSAVPLGGRLQARVPGPSLYQFQVGTGFEIRPVIQPDGQSVVFRLFYEHHIDIDEPSGGKAKNAPKAFGRIRRHLIDTDVRLATFELREISRYQVALRGERDGKGVPLLEDIPAVGKLFKPGISSGTLLQQNLILGEATIYPTLFDIMGIRMARAVNDLDFEHLRVGDQQLHQRQQRIRQHVLETVDETVETFFGLPEQPPLLEVLPEMPELR